MPYGAAGERKGSNSENPELKLISQIIFIFIFIFFFIIYKYHVYCLPRRDKLGNNYLIYSSA